MRTNKMTIKKAVAMALEEVKANMGNSCCKVVRSSIISRVAESIFDNVPYKWVDGGFRPLDDRKTHSGSFYDSIWMEMIKQKG